MNIGKLADYLKSIEDQDAEVLGIKFLGGRVWVDCIKPTSSEEESHKSLVTFFSEIGE